MRRRVGVGEADCKFALSVHADGWIGAHFPGRPINGSIGKERALCKHFDLTHMPATDLVALDHGLPRPRLRPAALTRWLRTKIQSSEQVYPQAELGCLSRRVRNAVDHPVDFKASVLAAWSGAH